MAWELEHADRRVHLALRGDPPDGVQCRQRRIAGNQLALGEWQLLDARVAVEDAYVRPLRVREEGGRRLHRGNGEVTPVEREHDERVSLSWDWVEGDLDALEEPRIRQGFGGVAYAPQAEEGVVRCVGNHALKDVRVGRRIEGGHDEVGDEQVMRAATSEMSLHGVLCGGEGLMSVDEVECLVAWLTQQLQVTLSSACFTPSSIGTHLAGLHRLTKLMHVD